MTSEKGGAGLIVLASDFCTDACQAKWRAASDRDFRPNPEFVRVYRETRKCLWCWDPTRSWP
jgi:hypothetical protein